MTNLKKLLGSGVITSALTLTALTPVFAADIQISGNGAHSDNTVTIINDSRCKIKQVNNTTVNTKVNVNQNTGDNEASGNTGGSNSITTGEATSSVSVSVTGSSNILPEDPCCCGNPAVPPSVLISGNGEHTDNVVTNTNTKKMKEKQINRLTARLRARVLQDTGKNKTKNNTGGDNTVTTGDTGSTIDHTVEGGTNQ